jgi:hypothetical protein
MRYAIIKDSIVTNVIIWDGVASWAPEDGESAKLLDADSRVGPGWIYDGQTYIEPPVA